MASKTILSGVNGYYPVIESLIRETSALTALVFGVVWRYCQWEKGFCTASQITIGEILGLDRHTVSKHLSILVEKGYLTETNGTGGSIYYHDTGKASPPEGVVKKLPSRGKKPANVWQNNYHDDGKKPATIKDSIKETIKESIKEESPKFSKTNIPYELAYSLSKALSEVTGLNINVNQKRLLDTACDLLQDERAKPEIILRDYGEGGDWYKLDWRGKKGDRPNLSAIKETFCNLKKKNNGSKWLDPDGNLVED